MSQKVAPPPKKNFLQFFHLYLREILPMFCQCISTHAFQFWSIYLIIYQNGVIFRSTYRFYRFKFRVSTSQIALVSLLWWVAPVHPTSMHWIIRFGGNVRVLTQAATQAKTSSRVLTCTLVNLVCVTGENHWQRCERLPQETAGMCVSQRRTFWTFNVIIHLTDSNY